MLKNGILGGVRGGGGLRVMVEIFARKGSRSIMWMTVREGDFQKVRPKKPCKRGGLTDLDAGGRFTVPIFVY